MKKKILESISQKAYTIDQLKQGGVQVIVMRCSGYNNIDHIRIKYAMINCIKYVDGSDDQKISCVADLVTCAQDACAHAHRMAKLEAGGLQKHI